MIFLKTSLILCAIRAEVVKSKHTAKMLNVALGETFIDQNKKEKMQSYFSINNNIFGAESF